MRLIPGKTKVQIELFKGVSLWDVLIGGVGVAMMLLVLFSSLPYKLAICIGILIIGGMLLIRMDTEPNYVMVLNMIKHLAYSRRYEKVYDDEMILKKSDGTMKEDLIKQYRTKNQEPLDFDADGFDEEDYADEMQGEAEQEPKELLLAEKQILKIENQILKSKKATKEQQDAVWLARANRTAAKKEAKKTGTKINQFSAAHLGEWAQADKAAGKGKKAKESAKKQSKKNEAHPGNDGQQEDSQEQGNDVQGSMQGDAQEQDGNAAAGNPQGLSEKELIKQENEILKSKTATQEEKDAVWLARAQRSAAKKEAKKQAQIEKTDNAEYDFMENIMAFTNVKDDYIEYGGKYYGTVIEIDPVEFRFFSEHRRNNSIELGVGRVLRSIHAGFAANIVKLERPIIYDKYLAKEEQKLEQLRKSYESGMMSEEEFQARIDIENDRLGELKGLCTDKQVVAPFYYIALFESDKKQLELQTKDALDALGKGELTVRRLNTKELAIFLKYTNQLDFNERDIEKYKPEDYAQWAMPQRVNVKVRTVEVNNIVTHNFRVVKYPSWVGDAWLANVLSMPATKVVIKCTPMDRGKAIRSIDQSLQELRGQYNATGVDSKRIELENHIETLGGLLATLQGEGEELLECNIYVTAYDVQSTRLALGVDEYKTLLPEISAMKKTIRRAWQENNFRLNDHFFNQMNAFIGSQVSAYDPEAKNGRGIPSNSMAACYPWVYAHISDEGGFKLGSSSGVPVFIDFFRRDSERVNSNMVIIGKSGSGKSYATKSILSNLASEDAKIFILDPENEYSELAHNLHGKVINVANAQYGRLNPFHIITALDDDEGGSAAGSFATHLQFLEEFYRQILPEIEKDALEYLNNLTERLYTNRGITPESDLSKLRPEDYPVFDDLYDAVLEEFERTDNEYIRSMLRTLINYVAKFSTGGRNANIWNGPSTVTTDENFTVFNFQAMLSNRNTTIANAQMLLVLKYIDNEIIKNRDYNSKYGLKRKVVVVIDEAHVFIDAKFPIALDFMFQLAKRIRKYNGMQVVITQNIKDFVGSEELARKSTAIINACQYSFIFALAPNDMHDLCTLYEKAGGISEIEQEQIIQAPRGQAFTVMSATSRSTFKVEVPKNMVDMFQDRDFHSRYYTGTDGEAAWEEFIGASRKIHDKNKKANKKASIIAIDDAKQEKNNWVRFEELTEEPVELPTLTPKKPKRSSKVTFEEIEDTDDFGMSDDDMDAMIAQHMAQKEAEKLKGIEAKIAEASAKDAGVADTAEEDFSAVEIDETEPVKVDTNVIKSDVVERAVQHGMRAKEPSRSAAGAMESQETREDTTQVIGQLKDVLADFVQAVRQPVPVAVPVTPVVQEQPKVDVEAIVADVRKQVMAQIMNEIQSSGMLPVEELGSRLPARDEDLDLFEADIDDEENAEEDDDLLALEAVLEDDTESEDYEELPEEPEEEEESDLDMDDLFESEDGEESEEEETEEEEYDFDDLFSSDDSEEDSGDDSDDDDDDGFDVMKMLRAEAKAIVEQKKGKIEQDVELADYVEDGGIADITLEDLAQLVTAMRKRKRAK